MHHVNYDLKDSYFRWKTKRQNSNQFFSATEVKELKYGVELEGILKKKKKRPKLPCSQKQTKRKESQCTTAPFFSSSNLSTNIINPSSESRI